MVTRKDKRIWDIVILSPHMDDAVLSLGQHLVNWQKENKKIKIITVMTSFGNDEKIPLYSKKYISSSGFKLVKDFGEARIWEDIGVMENLKVKYEHWGFVDAGFRRNDRGFTYPTRRGLFNRKISKGDYKMVAEISKKIAKLKSKIILIPAGVGGHVDHLIVKKAAEKSSSKTNRLSYLESPYLWENFNFLEIFKNIFKIKSIFAKVGSKNKLLKGYRSQCGLWGDYKFPYVEIIVKC
ncbi:MAG: hypothetical protein US68_C0016G0011 [Candidatus Shapirobacteria bacterium GW2011_GWE1_38_10]|uniref:LmbE family protein n=1 Tax=Candidatus Shapirobacteria bacterium GW2011_GWE1_38_10 TaxID=1618488 RepID=A0A0G0L9K7_9BACT|nr:MAG: hypothetical protein US46_C0009G0007 [Candidatus Shapirobacteria bacterium GW2011_GWF2_37_20]KKQ49351.1 MAG: hypothetical protein US68_C0016G0011 [Candidatus Shapirobacteria bacterium GW2011_GWE1_38_10]KKQ65080.1 MAG: hypothetical protein US85_C0001G0007 [Candidatus Shapirobacteria bacterium GW2011_GWF1_38_23]